MHDIIVVGGGPAGLTAAVYALRAGKTVLVIEKNAFGGQIAYSPKVENIPGTIQISGAEFADALTEQAMNLGADVELENVVSVEDRDGVKVVTDLELHSSLLGLHGRADVVEFHRDGAGWKPYPVEYKKGRPHKGIDADDVQLCAQALCLEEMLGTSISEGALFYGEARRRRVVFFDDALRTRTKEVILAVRLMMESGKTPPPQELPWCDACSLNGYCLPELFDTIASSYVRKLCEEQP